MIEPTINELESKQILSASDSSFLSSYYNSSKDDEQIHEIMDKIHEAVKTGDYSISIEFRVSPRVVDILTDLGYDVKQSISVLNDAAVFISWKNAKIDKKIINS